MAKQFKKNICKKCHQDILANEKRDMFMSHDTYHKLQVRDYCKEHELLYTDHKCKPIWCKKCRYLINYEIQVSNSCINSKLGLVVNIPDDSSVLQPLT